MSVSQPSFTLPLQLPQPESHAVMAQVPVEQLAVARGGAQATPQEPQLSRVVVEVSHPLLGLPSQLAQPGSHTGTQTPLTHEVVPWAFVHTLPQQAATVLPPSQPLAGFRSQS